jgi:hypothetical protein
MLLKMDKDHRDAFVKALNSIKKPEEVENTEKKEGVDKEIEDLGKKSKALSDTINFFCIAVDLTPKEMMHSFSGKMIIFGKMLSLGMFGSAWDIFVKGIFTIFLVCALVCLNIRRKITLTTKEKNIDLGLITDRSEEHLVPLFGPAFDGDKETQTAVAVIGSALCLIILVLTVIFS